MMSRPSPCARSIGNGASMPGSASRKRIRGQDTKSRVCAAYSDFRELVGRKDIDAVCIATPEHWHAIPAIEAMKAGKDVYCEKPLTLTLAEGKRMHRRGAQVRAGFPDRQPAAVRCLRQVPQGRRDSSAAAVWARSKPSRWASAARASGATCPGEEMEPGLDWDLWLGPAPMRPYNSILSPRGVHHHFPDWREYREYAGGGHADMGAHHYDIAQWCLGMDDSGPVEIMPAGCTRRPARA